MKKIITTTIASTLMASFLFTANASADVATKAVDIETPAAILINADNGDILYSKNEKGIYDIASVTKVMTMLIVSEQIKEGKIKWTDKVKISEKAWKISGSKMFVEVGEEWEVRELFKGLAIVSGNDAAIALAEHVAGSTDEFVKLMNKKAKELGMKDTMYYSPNGLGNGEGDFDRSTVVDLALLSKYYTSHFKENMKIHGTVEYTTKAKLNDITQSNANGLLGNYTGATGLKTGMVNGNYNIAATAQRGETKLIAVLLGSENSSQRTKDAASVLDYGFNQYTNMNKGLKDEVIGKINVYKSSSHKEVELKLQKDVNFIVHVNDEAEIDVKDDLPAYLKGGFKEGEVVGQRIVKVDDKEYKTNIVVAEDVEKSGFVEGTFSSVAMFFKWMTTKVLG